MAITVIIADDEPLAIKRLERLLAKITDVDLVASASNGQEVIALVNQHQPDVLLIDVEMPMMNGVEAATEIVNTFTAPPAIIFCTAYNKYALDAFSVSAAGYLLKPVELKELEEKLIAAQKVSNLQLKQFEAIEEQVKLTVAMDGFIGKVPVSDIYYFRSEEKVIVANVKGTEVVIDNTLKKLEESLMHSFIRIHRSVLVNKLYLHELFKNDQGGFSVVIHNKENTFSVSRRHLSQVKKCFQ